MRLSWCSIACLAAASLPLRAGIVEQSVITAEPQMQIKAGEVDGCGFVLKSISLKDVQQDSAMVLDASFNAYLSGIGLLKGGAMQARAMRTAPAFAVKPITGFWLKAEDALATRPVGDKVIPGENKGYLLYGVDLDVAVALFDSIMSGRQLTIGMRVQGEPIERIHTGVPQLSDADRAQSVRCLGDLIKRIENALNEPKDSATRN